MLSQFININDLTENLDEIEITYHSFNPKLVDIAVSYTMPLIAVSFFNNKEANMLKLVSFIENHYGISAN